MKDRWASLVEMAFKEAADKALRFSVDITPTDLDKLWKKSDARNMLKAMLKEAHDVR